MGDASDDVLSLDLVIQWIGSSGDLIKRSPVRLEQNHVVNFFYQQGKVSYRVLQAYPLWAKI